MDNKVHISRKQKKRPAGLKKNKRQTGPKLPPCPFPIGNQFWRLRSKHGRDKLFASPDLMWEAACEYFQWCVDHPWLKMEQTKATKSSAAFKIKEGEITDMATRDPAELTGLPTARPFTLTGLSLYLDCSEGYFRTFKLTCSEDFLAVITRIEHVIETQQFEGAVVGAYNANIIARKLGLAEKTDHSVKVNEPIEINYIVPGEDKDQHKANG